MEDPRLTRGTVQDTLILPSSVNGEAVTIGAGASAVMKHIHLVILALPSVSSGTSIIGYSIQYKVSSSSGAYLNISDPGSSATNIVISGLRNGEDYLIRVAAKTELGIGSDSYGSDRATTYDCMFTDY